MSLGNNDMNFSIQLADASAENASCDD